MGIKLVCGAAAAILAAGQVAHLPPERRVALWSGAGRLLGMEASGVAAPSAPAPAAQAAAPPSTVLGETVGPDRFGQFSTPVEIEGQHVPVIIDTGASTVCLTFDVAARLGYRPSPSEFRYTMSTANGPVAYAKVNLREIRLGTIVVRDVAALIAPRGALGQGLLGMNFLTRLSSFRTDTGRLVLQP